MLCKAKQSASSSWTAMHSSARRHISPSVGKVSLLFLSSQMLMTDGSKTSATKQLFTQKPIDKSMKPVLAENIRNSRGSHFTVGKYRI